MTDQVLNASQSDSQTRVILEMERKLNPAVFWRRLWKQDKFCTISTAQYWDWLTYIDVRNYLGWYWLRMTISPSGRSSKWKNFTSGNFKKWAVSLLLMFSSVGLWPTPSWDLLSSHPSTDGCWDSQLLWLLLPSWEYKPQTGSAPQRLSMKLCHSQHPTVHTYVAQSRSTSPCGGMMSVANWIPTATHFPRWLSTTRLLRCPKHTLALTLLSIEMIANNNTPHYLN